MEWLDMIPRNPVTTGRRRANANMVTNAASPTLEREAARNRRAEAKPDKAAEVGAVRAHEAHDLALSPAPDGRAVEAGAVPAALRAAEGQAPNHLEVLVLLRVLREEPRGSVEILQQRPYAVRISRTNANPRNVLTSIMDRAGSIRKGIARKARTANFNTLMNPALPRGALQTGSRPTRRGRKARRTAKREIDRTRPLPEEGALKREKGRRIKRKAMTRNPLPAHLEAVEARTRKMMKRKPRSLLLCLFWSI
jgi:hypothetical protein